MCTFAFEMRLTKEIQRAADERARKEDYFCASYYGRDEEKFYFIPMFADSQERTLGLFTYIVVKGGIARIHRGLNYGGLDGIRKRDFTKGRAIYREFERKYDNDDFINEEEREYISAIVQNQRPSYEVAVDRSTLYEYLEIADRFGMKLELVPEPHTMERNDGWEYYLKLAEFEERPLKSIPEEKMSRLIIRKCKEYGITPDILTSDEIKELKEEIRAEQSGYMILDGVLFNPEIYVRKYKRCEDK